MFSSNNPFVNDDMYFANRSHYIHSETRWYLVQMTYSCVCFITGMLLVILTCYLLFAKTSRHLKSYRKMLFLTTMMDLFVLIFCVGVQFRLRFVNDVLLLTLSGAFSVIFSYRQLCPVMCIYTVLGSIAVSILPVQYYYRYYTLVKDTSPSYFLISILLFFTLAPCILVSPKTSTIYCPSENPNPQGVDYAPMWFEEVPIPPLYVELPSEKSLWFYSNNVLMTIYYSVAIIYGFMTVWELKIKYALVMYSKSAKSMQRQLTRTMISQTVLPLIVLVVPQFLHQVTINLSISSDVFSTASKQSLALVPIFNMLACITFIKPYRRFCLRFVPCSKYYNYPCKTDVSPSTATATSNRMASSTNN